MSNQNDCKTIFINFVISKKPYEIDELMFSSALRQKLASTITQIVSIDNLRKELSSACNLNINSLKVYI